MKSLPATKLRQVAALALLLMTIVVPVAVAIVPLAGYVGGLRADIADRRERWSRLEAYAASKDKVEELARQNDSPARQAAFLPGDTDAMRAANLQALLTKTAETHGVRLLSSRMLAAADRDGLRFIGVQAELDLSIEQLKDLIAAFETMRPHLFVQSLHIAPHDMHGKTTTLLKVNLGIAGATPAPAIREGA
jgi:Type II secretion system (T2SS), protein M subtype b